MTRVKLVHNVLPALRLALWYVAHDPDDDGEWAERGEIAIAGLRSFWLSLTPDEQEWVIDALEEIDPEEAEGIRLAILHGNVGRAADMPDEEGAPASP
jgi:hypothetical protein